ncbi:hypothetical protein LA080_004605 [Diaporthe eres]|uniref:Uncharacterized protein n=1 Tax=Diaporthe vaccinii TaxID=105482 RepID=A0ABR4ETS1_9PEZI|nr:hypothetical protein LA080_004605 [Diaporthe eres]
MSSDTEPIILTVGSVDGRDQTKLSDEIPGSAANVPPRVPDNKLNNIEHRKEETRSNTGTAAKAQHDAASPHASSEPGVVGEIRTVGSADPVGGDAAASNRIESKQDQ